MTEIKDTTRYNIPLSILSQAGTWLLKFHSAYTTWQEAVTQVRKLESEGWAAKYMKGQGIANLVYAREPGKGRRY